MSARAGAAIVEQALAAARADDTIVIVTEETEASLRWAGNSMTTNGLATSQGWTVVSVRRERSGPDGGIVARVGCVSVSGADPEQLVDVVRASEEAAAVAEPASDDMPLLTPTEAGGSREIDWDAPAPDTDITVFEAVVSGLSAGFGGTHRHDALQLYGFADHQVSTTWLGTSTGIRRRWSEPTGSLEINGKREGGSAWVGAATADFTDVDVAGLLTQLQQRLDWGRRRVELPAGRYETLLPPSAVADLMVPMLWEMAGRAAHEGRSAFAAESETRIGEKLTDLPLTLYSDPAATGLQYQPFLTSTESSELASVFDNGLALPRVDWVRRGTVANLVYPRAAAKQFHTTPTALGDNLLMSGGSDATLADMVAATERGLLLTCLWYIRTVDPTTLLLTGLTRDGVYLVEDGEITAVTNNFRFNESPLELLRRVTEAGATVPVLPREWSDWITRTAMPPLRIPDFNMSSVSQAT